MEIFLKIFSTELSFKKKTKINIYLILEVQINNIALTYERENHTLQTN